MSVSLFIASLPYWYSVNIRYLQFWMSYLSQIFWRHSWDVCTLILNNFKFLVCLSVCSLPDFLTKIWLTLDIFSSGWNYEILCVKNLHTVGLWFEALGVLRSKSWRKETPFFVKKWGSIFFNVLIRALLRPQIAIRRRANISCVIFSWFWPLKIEKSEKKLYGHNPLRILNHIGY